MAPLCSVAQSARKSSLLSAAKKARLRKASLPRVRFRSDVGPAVGIASLDCFASSASAAAAGIGSTLAVGSAASAGVGAAGAGASASAAASNGNALGAASGGPVRLCLPTSNQSTHHFAS